jgi:hypothetical protein
MLSSGAETRQAIILAFRIEESSSWIFRSS